MVLAGPGGHPRASYLDDRKDLDGGLEGQEEELEGDLAHL